MIEDEKGFDALDYIFRLKVDEHHSAEDTEEAILKDHYPDMVKAEIPYCQEINKKEPEKEIRELYSDMDLKDL